MADESPSILKSIKLIVKLDTTACVIGVEELAGLISFKMHACSNNFTVCRYYMYLQKVAKCISSWNAPFSHFTRLGNLYVVQL